MQVVVIHLLGDVPAVPLLGWLQDRVHNWRYVVTCQQLLLPCLVSAQRHASLCAEPSTRQQWMLSCGAVRATDVHMSAEANLWPSDHQGNSRP